MKLKEIVVIKFSYSRKTGKLTMITINMPSKLSKRRLEMIQAVSNILKGVLQEE